MKYNPKKMPRDDIALEISKLKPGDIVAFYADFPLNLKWQRQEKEVENLFEVSRHIIRGYKKNRFETTLLYAHPHRFRRRIFKYLPGDNYTLARSTFLERTWKKM